MKRKTPGFSILVLFALFLFAVASCGSAEATVVVEHERTRDGTEREHEREMPKLGEVSLVPGEKLRVVATTSIVADVVHNVGGDRIELTRLMPAGADPHTFEPTPRDVAAVYDAHVLFASGAGLEEFLEPLLESAGAEERTIQLSHGMALLELDGENEHDHDGADPHTWLDPANVMLWVQDIEHALSGLDPANAEAYETAADAYERELEELDHWVWEQVTLVPEVDRQIVTDHQLYAYFAGKYGFEQVGAIVPAYSTVAEPSAREVAALEDAVTDLGVKAVFVGNTVNPGLAQRLAEDTGIQLVFIYTGSLTEEGGQADSYLDYMRYNVRAIVNALR